MTVARGAVRGTLVEDTVVEVKKEAGGGTATARSSEIKAKLRRV